MTFLHFMLRQLVMYRPWHKKMIASPLSCFSTMLQLIKMHYTTLDPVFIALHDVSVMQFPRPVVSEKESCFWVCNSVSFDRKQDIF